MKNFIQWGRDGSAKHHPQIYSSSGWAARLRADNRFLTCVGASLTNQEPGTALTVQSQSTVPVDTQVLQGLLRFPPQDRSHVNVSVAVHELSNWYPCISQQIIIAAAIVLCAELSARTRNLRHELSTLLKCNLLCPHLPKKNGHSNHLYGQCATCSFFNISLTSSALSFF